MVAKDYPKTIKLHKNGDISPNKEILQEIKGKSYSFTIFEALDLISDLSAKLAVNEQCNRS